MNATGSLVIRSEKVGSQTVLSQIVQMVAQAQRSRAPMQRMADKVAGVFVVGVVSVALLTFFAWGIFGPQPGWCSASSMRWRCSSLRAPVRWVLRRPCPSWSQAGKEPQPGFSFETLPRLKI